MSFKPKQSPSQTPINPNVPRIDWSALNKLVKKGSRPARISLIVDLGEQDRDPSKVEYNASLDKHKEALEKGSYIEVGDGKEFILTPRKPVQQIAVLADLVNDVVDYGGDIGKQPYRIILNPSVKGDIRGIDLVGCYSYDEKGKRLENKGFTFHSQSLLTKLAKATNTLQIITDGHEDNMDVSLLAGKAFMAQIDVTESGDKTYVNYKGAAVVPDVPDEDGNEAPMKIKPLTNEARVITFDSVTEDDVKFLRYELVKKIKQAKNYHGSKMQQVLESSTSKPAEPSNDVGNTKVAETKKAAPKAAVSANEPPPSMDFEDDIPFMRFASGRLSYVV